MGRWQTIAAGLLATLAATAVAQTVAPSPPPGVTAPPARLSPGYLPAGPMPDSLLLSPAPPAAGSPAEARDVAASRAGLALRSTPRWAVATSDADVFGPAETHAFSCAAGIVLDPATTPATVRLLRTTIADLALSTQAIKRRYQRARPFMVNGRPTCTPDLEPVLRRDGSYPSGHSAIGYGWGLILAELLPDRAAQLVARGRAYGDSRRICNVHWLSDVEEGRVLGAATVARLHANARFRADLDAARAELARVRAAPTGCAAEAAALAINPPEGTP